MTTFADMLFQLGGMPVIPPGYPVPSKTGKYIFVDGTNGADGNSGLTVNRAVATLSQALTIIGTKPGYTIIVLAQEMLETSTDPVSYAGGVTITAPQTTIIGVSRGRTQGGLPQIKTGSGTAPLITVQAPGCGIFDLGFNGSGSTGGGIKLMDNGGVTYASFGFTIAGCHFKNCVGSTATDASTGGAIQLSGAPWQGSIRGNRFYSNVGDVVLLDTSNAAPKDLSIVGNEFSDSASATDCNLFLAGGSGVASGLLIADNRFGAFPNLLNGVHKTYMSLTGCTGTMSNNTFGSSGKTFGAAGNVLVPTTVLMSGNYQEIAAGANATGEVGRT